MWKGITVLYDVIITDFNLMKQTVATHSIIPTTFNFPRDMKTVLKINYSNEVSRVLNC